MDKTYQNKNLISPIIGGSAFSIMIALFLLVTLIGQLILMACGVSDGAVFQAISGTFSIIAISLITVYASKRTGVKLKTLSGVEKFNPLFILLALLFSASMFFGLGFVNSVIAEFLTGIGLNGSGISLDLTGNGKLLVFLIVFALLPAVVEEVFFRGLILKSLKNSGLLLSSIFCALFFALYHTSFVQLVYQFIYGIGLCVIARLSKSTIPCMISHFFNNAVVLLLQYFNVAINLFNPYIILGGLLGLFAFSLIVMLLVKKQDKTEIKRVDKSVKDFLLASLIGALVCLVLMISALFN